MAAADPPRRYVAITLPRGQAAATPGAITRFSLDGAAAPGGWSRQGIGAGAGFAVEVGRRYPAGGGDLRIGAGLTARRPIQITSSSGFSARGISVQGGGVLTASGRASARLDVRNATLMAVLRYDAKVLSVAGLTPWLGAGVGWSRNRVDAFRIGYRAEMRVVSPSRDETARFPHASQYVPARHFDDLAWEISAGLSTELRPGWHASLGVRYASLGSYRLAGPGDGPARLTLDDQALEIDFGGARDRLRLREITLTLRHEF